MSEFVGRTGSLRVYSYPERRGGNPAALFARNFALGPTLDTAIADTLGTQVPWNAIESGAPADVNVPITPRSTGIILISGVVVVKSSGSTSSVELLVEIGGVPLLIPDLERNTITGAGFEAIPFLTENIALLPIGVTANVSIRLIASAAGILVFSAMSSTINIQEVLAATG